MNPQERMKAYRAAYKAANHRSIGISYAHGWYYVQTGGGTKASFRAGQIESMTATLRSFAESRK